MTAGVLMAVTDDLPEVVTRKVGPLPAWGWVAAIVGAYAVYRVFSSGSSQSGSATVVGGTPTSFGDGTDSATGDDIFSGASSLVQQIQTQVGTLGNVQQLLTQLSGLLNQRSTLLSQQATQQERLNAWRDALRACKTTACKKKANDRIASYSKGLDTTKTALATLNAKIADLQTKIEAANG
jgi:hypothetical protein